MKNLLIYIFALVTVTVFSQEEDMDALLKATKNANDLVFEANTLLEKDDFISAEMAYREAISEAPTETVGGYNLGTSQIIEGNLEEALYQLQKSAKAATSKSEKHQAFHNIGNILMQNKKCKEAVEAYKNALRNNPTDDESRYNLALAKDCAKQQEDQNQDDNQDENKDKDQDKDQDKEGDKDDQKDKGDQDKQEGDDKKDEDGKPKDDKEDKGKENQDPGKDKEEKQQPPQPQPGQMSPQQMKNLLEAMNNNEAKVQEKMNAEKQKGVKVQTEKDW